MDLELQWTKNVFSLHSVIVLLFSHNLLIVLPQNMRNNAVLFNVSFCANLFINFWNYDFFSELRSNSMLCPSYYYLSCLGRFFAGGSERSGQQIVGPPKKKSSNEVVEDLFKGAREHGAVPLDRSGKGPGESSKARVSWKPMLSLFTSLIFCCYCCLWFYFRCLS